MRIPAGTLYGTFEKILLQRGATEENAAWATQNFTDSRLDSVYSHGVNDSLRLQIPSTGDWRTRPVAWPRRTAPAASGRRVLRR